MLSTQTKLLSDKALLPAPPLQFNPVISVHTEYMYVLTILENMLHY